MVLLKTELLSVSGSRVLRSLNGVQEQSVALMGSGNKIFFLCRELMQTKEVLLERWSRFDSRTLVTIFVFQLPGPVLRTHRARNSGADLQGRL